jgi:hypothetical protein
MSATPTSSALAPSTTITAQEIVRAGAEVARELQNTNTPVEVDCSRFLNLVNNVRAEVGEDVFASFVHVAASLYPPAPEAPEVPFTLADAIRAGREYEEEKYAHGCYGCFPNYTPHPAFDRLEMMALAPLPENFDVTQAITDEMANQEISRPWDGDLHGYMYRSFMDTWEELLWSRAEEQANRFARRHDDDDFSVFSWTGANNDTLESLPGSPVPINPRPATPPSAEVPFTPREFLDAGIALDAEMQAHNCEAAHPTYTPHPAFDTFMEMWRLLRNTGGYALMFIHGGLGGLGRAGVVEWISLAHTYHVLGDEMFFRDVDFLLFSESRPQVMAWDTAVSIVDTFERTNIASLAPEDMRCAICYSDFDETVLSPEGLPVDDSPVKTPCCGQIFGLNCFIQALLSDCRCSMCRTCCVGHVGNESD